MLSPNISAEQILAGFWGACCSIEARLAGMVPALGAMSVSEPAPFERPPDAEIKRTVESRLRRNRFLRPSGIYVQVVYDGIVVLAGTACTAEEDVLAFEEAVGVPGVRRVASEVVVQGGTCSAVEAA